MAEENNVNMKIGLHPELFLTQGGLFPDTYAGKFTSVCNIFQKSRGVLS